MASLGSMVVRMALENLPGYKADLAQAAKATEAAGKSIEQSMDKAGEAAAGMGQKTEEAGRRTRESHQETDKSVAKLLERLERQRQTFGMNTAELRRYEAARVSATAEERKAINTHLQAIEALEREAEAQNDVMTMAGRMASSVGLAGATLAALVVALGVAAYAAHQGSKENRAFETALIMSGNAAGTTASQMQAMAKGVSAVVGTQGKAAEVLAQLATGGQVAKENLQGFTQTAVYMEKIVGTSVADTVKVFGELAEEPVRASLKLNQSLNYLTAATFAQIKAAKDLGDNETAASIAQNAYAQAMDGRTERIKANLGTLEKAWMGVTGWAKKAWDSMLGLGREAGVEQELEAAKKAVANLESLIAKGGTRVPELQRQLDAAKANLEVTRESARLAEKSASWQAEQAAGEKARIAWMQDGEQLLNKKEQLERAIAKIRADGARAGASELEIEHRIANAREKYKEAKGPDDYGRIGAEIEKALNLAKQQLDMGVRLNESDKFRIETQLHIDEALRKGNITKAQALKLEQAMPVAQGARIDVERQLNATKANVAQYQDQVAFQEELNAAYVAESKAREQARLAVDGYERGIADSNKLLELEISLMGKSAEQRDIALQQYQIELDLKRQIEAIDRSAGLDEAQREELRARARVAAASASAQASSRAVLTQWRKTADQIDDSLTDALMRGFENGKSIAENFRDSVANMFKTLVLRPIVSAVVTPVSALLAGAGNSSVMAGQSTGMLGQLKSVYDTITGSFGNFADGVSKFSATVGKWMVDNTTGVMQRFGSQLYARAGTIGQYGAYGMGALAGYGLGSAISGGRSVFGDGNQDIATLGGTAIGAFFGGPVGAAIGGAIGGAVNRMFGQGAKEITASGIQGTFSGSTFSGQSYQEWSRAGGWFNSGSSGVDYRALDSGYAGNLGKAYAAVTSQTAALADALGQPTAQITGYVKTIRLDSSQLNEAGIKSLFEGIADELANTVVQGYVQEGERASTALTRLASSLATVNSAFDLLGKSALSAGVATADSASKLVDLMGGGRRIQHRYGQLQPEVLHRGGAERQDDAPADRCLCRAGRDHAHHD